MVAAAALAAAPARADVTAVNVTPAGDPATWSSSTTVYVGDYTYNKAALSIDGGSALATGTAYIGGALQTKATVDGAGSSWRVNNDLYVGYNPQSLSPYFGTLYVSNGGSLVVRGRMGVAFNPYSSFGTGAGSVFVDGAGSSLSAGTLTINGSFDITNGATVHAGAVDHDDYAIKIDGSGSLLSVDHSLTISQALALADGGQAQIGGTTTLTGYGSIQFLTNGGTVNTGTLIMGTPATALTGTGIINTRGLVTDADLLFDAAHGVSQTLTFAAAGQNVALNLDVSGAGGPAGDLAAGNTGAGSLTIRDGVNVVSANGYVGYASGAHGTATVDGAGSTWTVGGDLTINGGTLHVEHGGTVAAAGQLAVNGTGNTIDFGTGGGTLNVQTLAADPSEVTGTGTINTRGIISNIDLTFDATHGQTQTLTWNGPGQDVTVNLDMSGGGAPGELGVRNLTITNGVVIHSAAGYVGYAGISPATATVDGSGSEWDNQGALNLGDPSGAAVTLDITQGGTVRTGSLMTSAANNNAGVTTVNVDGARSLLSAGSISYDGALNITNGGSVQSGGTTLAGMTTVDGAGSNLTATTLTVQGALDIVHGAHGATDSSGGYNSVTINGMVNVDGAGSELDINNGMLSLGQNAPGTLNITNGGTVSLTSQVQNNGYGVSIGSGYGTNAVGTVTVDGAGSTLNAGTHLYVGEVGTGTLNITNGGSVIVDGPMYVAYRSGSAGTIAFGTNGGTLTTDTLYAGAAQVSGTGTIVAHGIVADGDIVFDATHGTQQTMTWTGDGTNVAINLDMPNTPLGDLGAGYQGAGTLAIKDGVQVSSQGGYLGFGSGSVGHAIVDGTGSKWTVTGTLYVGRSGQGNLTISHGGVVDNTGATPSAGTTYIDGASGSSVTVDGVGSTFATGNVLSVGQSESGSMNVTNGGSVTTPGQAYIGRYNYGAFPAGTVTVDGAGSTWTIGAAENGRLEIGSGTMTLSHGGTVSVAGTTQLTVMSGGTGTMSFGDGGGTLNTQSLYGSPAQISGTGTINARGLVSDADLVFDATHGPAQTLTWNGTGQNVAVNLDVSGAHGPAGDLGVGYTGAGSMTIRDGVQISSANGMLGDVAGSSGTAIVDGPGSLWTLSGDLTVGDGGTGALTVSNGAGVSVAGTTWLGADQARSTSAPPAAER